MKGENRNYRLRSEELPTLYLYSVMGVLVVYSEEVLYLRSRERSQSRLGKSS